MKLNEFPFAQTSLPSDKDCAEQHNSTHYNVYHHHAKGGNEKMTPTVKNL